MRSLRHGGGIRDAEPPGGPGNRGPGLVTAPAPSLAVRRDPAAPSTTGSPMKFSRVHRADPTQVGMPVGACRTAGEPAHPHRRDDTTGRAAHLVGRNHQQPPTASTTSRRRRAAHRGELRPRVAAADADRAAGPPGRLNWFPDLRPVALRVRVGRHWSLERSAALDGRTWRFARRRQPVVRIREDDRYHAIVGRQSEQARDRDPVRWRAEDVDRTLWTVGRRRRPGATPGSATAARDGVVRHASKWSSPQRFVVQSVR